MAVRSCSCPASARAAPYAAVRQQSQTSGWLANSHIELPVGRLHCAVSVVSSRSPLLQRCNKTGRKASNAKEALSRERSPLVTAFLKAPLKAAEWEGAGLHIPTVLGIAGNALRRRKGLVVCQSSKQDGQGEDDAEVVKAASEVAEKVASSAKYATSSIMSRLVRSKLWFVVLALTLLGLGGSYGYLLYQYADIPIIVAQKAASARLN